jgi:hypothetical protein
VRKVCTVEIITPLAEAAAKVPRKLSHDNVSAKVGDGYHGWLECGPCDAVIVVAAGQPKQRSPLGFEPNHQVTCLDVASPTASAKFSRPTFQAPCTLC